MNTSGSNRTSQRAVGLGSMLKVNYFINIAAVKIIPQQPIRVLTLGVGNGVRSPV